jgi:hypothetical protein
MTKFIPDIKYCRQESFSNFFKLWKLAFGTNQFQCRLDFSFNLNNTLGPHVSLDPFLLWRALAAAPCFRHLPPRLLTPAAAAARWPPHATARGQSSGCITQPLLRRCATRCHAVENPRTRTRLIGNQVEHRLRQTVAVHFTPPSGPFLCHLIEQNIVPSSHAQRRPAATPCLHPNHHPKRVRANPAILPRLTPIASEPASSPESHFSPSSMNSTARLPHRRIRHLR